MKVLRLLEVQFVRLINDDVSVASLCSLFR